MPNNELNNNSSNTITAPIIKQPNLIFPLITGITLFTIVITTGCLIVIKNSKNDSINDSNNIANINLNKQNENNSILNTTILFSPTPINNPQSNQITYTPSITPAITANISNLTNKISPTGTIKTTIPPVITTKVVTTTKISTFTDTPTPVPTTTSALSKYINGTYSADGSYYVPDAGSNQKIGLTITLSNDSISSITITSKGPASESIQWQNQFTTGLQDSGLVVGKPLDTNFTFTKINGSSLTYIGFRNALLPIKTAALR